VKLDALLRHVGWHWACFLLCSLDPNNVGDRILAGFISSLFLAPVQNVFPFLFKSINTFRSYTLTRMEQLKKQALKKRKSAQRQAAKAAKEAARLAAGGAPAKTSLWTRIRKSACKAETRLHFPLLLPPPPCAGIDARQHGVLVHSWCGAVRSGIERKVEQSCCILRAACLLSARSYGSVARQPRLPGSGTAGNCVYYLEASLQGLAGRPSGRPFGGKQGAGAREQMRSH
jgi:hypothetical protein